MRGEADCAAIDSNYLLLMRRRDPLLAASLRVVESLGPHAIQPVVARAGLEPELHAAITRALLEMHQHARWGDLLHHHGVLRFDAVGESDYAGERRALRRCESQTSFVLSGKDSSVDFGLGRKAADVEVLGSAAKPR